MAEDYTNHGYATYGNQGGGKSVKKVILTIIFALLISAISVLFVYKYLTSRTFKEVVDTYATGKNNPFKAFPGKREINILLMGRDVDRDRYGRIVQTHGRTDAMMLVHVNFQDKSADILSLPRDTLVHIPGYRGKRRISYANALGGPELAVETVEQFLGVRPDYYVLVNFEAFEKAIDALGGLEVTVDKKLDYDDNWGNLHIHLMPGRQVLNGEQAMGFVRYRQSKNGDMESDFARISRQQELLRAVKAKLSNPSVLFRVPNVLDTIRDDIKSNLTSEQMVCLAHFLKNLQGNSKIRMETLPAINENGIFVRADVDATRHLVREMFFENKE
jgi:LCP family protein required for cell wall assembly